MSDNICAENYSKLEQLLGELTALPDYMKGKADGFMDLHVDRLREENEAIVIALAHHFSMNGDQVPDPDMEVRILLKEKQAEALTYQDQFAYRQVYHNGQLTSTELKQELNKFLNSWLNNLLEQGHKFEANQSSE